MAKADLTININAKDNASKNLKGIAHELGDLGTQGKKSSSILEGFSGAVIGLNQGLELAKKGLEAAKAAFEFTREGAQLSQLTESFGNLGDQLRVTPDLMQELRDASRGTVDDMTLMSSVLTLVAGESDAMAKSMMEAAPQLIEIAKAANKLNPALGDTDFFVDSIFKGIKRGQPLILDNLGIVVSVADANKKYADALGKTVDQLTDAEKRQALLNATMEAGGKIIDQVGGDVESQTDAWDRLTVTMTNMTNSLKQDVAPAIRNAVTALDLLLNWTNKVRAAKMDMNDRLIRTTESYDDYIIALFEAKDAAYGLNKAEERVLDGLRKGIIVYGQADKIQRGQSATIANLINKMEGLNAIQWELSASGAEMEREELNAIDRAKRLAAERKSLTNVYVEAREEIIKSNEAMRAATYFAEDMYEGFVDLYGAVDELGESYVNVVALSASLNGKLDEQIETLDEMRVKYDNMTEAQKRSAAGKELAEGIASGLQSVNDQLSVMFSQQAVMNLLKSGIEGAEQAAYDLAFEMGIIDETTYNTHTTLTNMTDYLATEGTAGIETYKSMAAGLNSELEGFHDRSFTVEMYMDTIYRERREQYQPEQGPQDEMYASGTGGQFLTVPQGYPNDSYSIGLTSGEQFLVKSTSEVARGGGNVSMGGAAGVGGQIVININNPIVTDEDSFRRMVEPAVIEVVRRQEAIRGY